jgi:protoporphyrinogen IX oxidase
MTMTNPTQIALVWLHIVGNLVWIGSILAVAATITGQAGEAKIRGELGLRIYRALSVPAFVTSFVAGTARLLMDTKYYLSEHHWMHGKLLFALIVIGIHHVIGGRAKKLARGSVQDAGPTATMAAVLLVSAIIAAFFVIFRVPN